MEALQYKNSLHINSKGLIKSIQIDYNGKMEIDINVNVRKVNFTKETILHNKK